MEFKQGAIAVTKDGEYTIKKIMTLYNPFNLSPMLSIVVDDNGTERYISEKEIISVKNNHIDNIEEP